MRSSALPLSYQSATQAATEKVKRVLVDVGIRGRVFSDFLQQRELFFTEFMLMYLSLVRPPLAGNNRSISFFHSRMYLS